MKPAPLTQVKYIGEARMKLLHAHGIETIEQLQQTPLEKLARIKSIGRHFAALIKKALKDVYPKEADDAPTPSPPTKKKQSSQINLDLKRETKRLRKRLERTVEELKPLWEKRYLKLFIDLKNKANKLKTRLKKANQIAPTLPLKKKKKILKETRALRTKLKNAAKKPKKKEYKTIAGEIQTLSKRLQKMSS